MSGESGSVTFVVRLALEYGGGTIDLLEKHEAGHLVRQGHRGQTHSFTTSIEHGRIQAVRPAEDERDVSRLLIGLYLGCYAND